MKLNFDTSSDGLLPVIVQDATTKNILMLGYMNAEAYAVTCEKKQVTFYSRSKKRLWTKGESSGNTLRVVAIDIDCDGDTVLVFANPDGPTCHLGRYSCFPKVQSTTGQFYRLQQTIAERAKQESDSQSYTKRLLQNDVSRIAQKVGEEAVEVVIAALKKDKSELLSESADLLYHLSVLWKKCDITFDEVEEVLYQRSQPNDSK